MINSLASDSSGNRIFSDSNGLFGIIDSNDRIIVAPEWLDLKFTDGSLCIAKQRTDGNLLVGCIDYEGNISVPFIYQNIEHHQEKDF
ncbi:MAG: WG repeat-containing protein, partial [Ruminococcus sp.]|nr:WG repeat-containing protein [Ruminococcus sp.]